MSKPRSEILQQFGHNIRQLRETKGLSQEQFAFTVGLHRTYIGSVERGERNVSLVNIVLIAAALETSISELFEGIDV